MSKDSSCKDIGKTTTDRKSETVSNLSVDSIEQFIVAFSKFVVMNGLLDTPAGVSEVEEVGR